jgi:hypothetical protein|tara:strand:- start:267 stop:386 length:120 start_codon:yes stop_codon:yes gene_type:complete
MAKTAGTSSSLSSCLQLTLPSLQAMLIKDEVKDLPLFIE